MLTFHTICINTWKKTTENRDETRNQKLETRNHNRERSAEKWGVAEMVPFSAEKCGLLQKL